MLGWLDSSRLGIRPLSFWTDVADPSSPSIMYILHRLFGQPASVPTTELVQPDDTRFPEEPLSLSAEQGFGFFPARAGLLLNGRYKILRKLGRGQSSTSWLFSDSRCVYLDLYLRCRLSLHQERKKRQPITPSKYWRFMRPWLISMAFYLNWKLWKPLQGWNPAPLSSLISLITLRPTDRMDSTFAWFSQC